MYIVFGKSAAECPATVLVLRERITRPASVCCYEVADVVGTSMLSRLDAITINSMARSPNVSRVS